MDQLTALRTLGENTAAPTDHALALGRATLQQHIADTANQPSQAPTRRRSVDAGRVVPTPRASIWSGELRAHGTDGEERHRIRGAFLTLGGIAAAVAVVTLVVLNSLGVGAWQPHNDPSAPAAGTSQTSTSSTFVLPTDCADVAGSTILPEWAPQFGKADALPELGGVRRIPGSDAVWVHCVYGDNSMNRILALNVSSLDTAPGGREKAEQQTRQDAPASLYDVTEQPVEGGTLFTTTKHGDYVEVGVTLVTDKATISVAALGTEQGPAELLPHLESWLDDIAARTGATG